MATGDLTVFEECADYLGEATVDLEANTLNFGIVDNVAAPTATDATPAWGDYSANEIGTGGGYVGPVALTQGWAEAAGVGTLQLTSFTISQNGSGQGSVTAWGVIYDDTSAGDSAIAFVELGTIDITAGDVVVKFNNAASGVLGDALTITVS